MSTPIEDFLYGRGPLLGIVAFALEPGAIRMLLAPWEGPVRRTEAHFADVRITSIEVSSDVDDDLNLPWDIIGFDGRDIGGGRWEFCMHCDVIDVVFKSAWPTVSRTAEVTDPMARP